MTRAIVTCSTHFTGLALGELKRHHSGLRLVHPLTPYWLLIEAPGSFDALTRPWRHKLPIYLHHLYPVHSTIDLKGDLTDLETLKAAYTTLSSGPATLQVRLDHEARLPYDAVTVERCLAGQQAPPCIPPTGRVVNVLVAGSGQTLRGYIGVSWASQNLSPWVGGQVPYAESVPNRAGYKLIEAEDVFDLRLEAGMHALDLGAAPGAWTTLLRRRGLHVTAVAPTEEWYPWLVADDCVSMHCMTAEAYEEECEDRFDVVVNDMKMDPQDSAKLMIDYAKHMHKNGIAVMTLKLRKRDPRRVMDHSLRLLRKAYRVVRMRQLVSNRSEVTLLLHRK